ncbi:hypothetical protein PV797_18490 [Clostridiaceae bacterium M8S5]|nr:hypothetical protein PV797_18490 [Clostridiaceae bacterium M8S5]
MKKVVLTDKSVILVKINTEDQLCIKCLYYKHGHWYPTVILKKDIISLTDIRNSSPPANTLHEDSLGFDNLTYTQKLNDVGGCELFVLRNNTITLDNLHYLNNSKLPSFPEPQRSWRYTGLPSKIDITKKNGELIEYVPIHIYATKDGNQSVILSKSSNILGYLDVDNNFYKSFHLNSYFKKDQLLFILLLDKISPSCKGCSINKNSYWSLITETPSYNLEEHPYYITLNCGLTNNDIPVFNLAIGSNTFINNNNGRLYSMLSNKLSSSFNTNINISNYLTKTNKLTFKNDSLSKSISIYQYNEVYSISPSNSLISKINELNNSDYIGSFARATFKPTVYEYNCNIFSKSFIYDS